MSKTLAIDFDQTLTRDTNYNPYPELGEEVPDLEMITWVNDQYQYHEIIIYTARDEELREETRAWLENQGVQYDKLVMGKVDADFYIDDKAVSPGTAKSSESVQHLEHRI